MKKLKIVLIGAGSRSFGRKTIADIISNVLLNELKIDLWLVDINKKSLDLMHKFAVLTKKYYKRKNISISATIDRVKALENADYVITAVATNRVQFWQADFFIPHSFGFQHVFGENGGIGGAFHALNNLGIMIPIAKDMEKLCPEALLMNFTNPESRIVMGVTKLTKINAVGLCHGFYDSHMLVHKILNKKSGEVDIDIGGINHFHWTLRIRDVKTGKDLLDEFHNKLRARMDELPPLIRYMFKTFGYVPFPVDDHIGEFVSFGYSMIGPLFIDHQYKHMISNKNPVKDPFLDSIRKKRIVSKDLVKPSREIAVSIICDIEFDRGNKVPSVNILNSDSFIENIDRDAIVEIPATVDKNGIRGVKVPRLPEGIAAMCRQQVSIQKLLVEAFAEKSRKKLLQVFTIDPTVTDVKNLEQMLEMMYKIEGDFLPVLH